MGEYAINQMREDFKSITGFDACRSDFELEKRPPDPKKQCPNCCRYFRLPQAVADHMRDKHGILL